MKRFSLQTVAVMIVASLSVAAQAQSIGWPEATNALAKEKSKAQACVDLLGSVADKKTRAEVEPVYLDARATSDGVIAGLSTLLVERGKPGDLPGFKDNLEKAGLGLQKVCDAAANAAQASTGKKGPIGEIITASIGPIVDALKSAVGGIFDYWKETKKIEREMILGQLRDAKWPEF
jgi:hypothetical protein